MNPVHTCHTCIDRFRSLLLAAVPVAALALSPSFASAGTRVAFLGDQGVGEDARAVLSMIRDEGVDLVIILGDLGYIDGSAPRWEANLTEAFGADFPVLSLVGNHEGYEWPVYSRYIRDRVGRASGLHCDGTVGVKARCRFGNIDIVQASPGIHEVEGVDGADDYAGYIRSQFPPGSDSGGRWRICAWHKNQHAMQTGSKTDETGWDVFDACLDAGAMVGMAHEHVYSRTYLLSDFRTQDVVHYDSRMTMQPGQSFAFVSGLGGWQIRPQVTGGDWWASIYTATQGASYGALFCDFGTSEAECAFKAVDGAVPDRFSLTLPSASGTAVSVNASAPVVSPAPVLDGGSAAMTVQGGVFARTDKNEYRWIAPDAEGVMSSVWIDAACVDRLGGVSIRGDWRDLRALTPAFDTIASPCSNSGSLSTALLVPSEAEAVIDSAGGYVFSRTDKHELRWIAMDSSGQLGSVWIDDACATALGGASVYGAWRDLMRQAPGFDTIDYPCR